MVKEGIGDPARLARVFLVNGNDLGFAVSLRGWSGFICGKIPAN
jgi:hypothetical protein